MLEVISVIFLGIDLVTERGLNGGSWVRWIVVFIFRGRVIG